MSPQTPHERPVVYPESALDPNRVRLRRITEVLPQKLRQYELDAWLTFTR